MKGLTPKQQAILSFIQSFIEQHHYAPTYREIMQHFGFSSPGSVYKFIRSLQQKGALSLDKHAHRSLMPLVEPPKPSAPSPELRIPLIGNFSAGYPLELFMRSQSLAVPPSLIHVPDSTYILQVQGDALREEGIQNGDLLLIEARQDVQTGEIILGLINQHDSVLKRYYPEGQYVRLESQHPHLPSLTIRSEHIAIQGVLVGLLRIF